MARARAKDSARALAKALVVGGAVAGGRLPLRRVLRSSTVRWSRIATLMHPTTTTCSPESQIRSPGSQIRSPGSQIRSPESQIRSPESQIRRAGFVDGPQALM